MTLQLVTGSTLQSQHNMPIEMQIDLQSQHNMAIKMRIDLQCISKFIFDTNTTPYNHTKQNYNYHLNFLAKSPL